MITPEEHERSRRTVWIEAMKAFCMTTATWECSYAVEEFAGLILQAFDTTFPAPKEVGAE